MKAERDLHTKANQFAGAADASMAAMGSVYVPSDTETRAKGGAVSLPSPMDASPAQWRALMDAAQANTPFKASTELKSAHSEYPVGPLRQVGPIVTKASAPSTTVLESGIGGSFSGTLPPIMSPFAVGIAYDPLDVASLFPAVQMPGPSATQIVHSSNTNEAAITGEAQPKPDLGPGFTINQIVPSKVAVTVTTTLEAWQDTDRYEDGSFARFLPVEATASHNNKRSDILLNAISGTADATFDGLLSVSGTLAQDATGLKSLDAINLGMVAIRNGSAKANPDLIIISPNTYGALRRTVDLDGRYVLDLLAGPLNLSAYGQPETARPAGDGAQYFRESIGAQPFSGSIWGCEVAVTTHIPDGTAAIVSVRGGGGLVWVRQGMEMFFNPGYGDVSFQNNLMAWRIESRLSFNVPRPTAVCIVSNLPTS